MTAKSEKKDFIKGYLAHRVLTDVEWQAEREKVARCLWARKWRTSWDQYSLGRETATPESNDLRAAEVRDAEAVLVALGYTRTSTTGERE